MQEYHGGNTIINPLHETNHPVWSINSLLNIEECTRKNTRQDTNSNSSQTWPCNFLSLDIAKLRSWMKKKIAWTTLLLALITFAFLDLHMPRPQSARRLEAKCSILRKGTYDLSTRYRNWSSRNNTAMNRAWKSKHNARENTWTWEINRNRCSNSVRTNSYLISFPRMLLPGNVRVVVYKILTIYVSYQTSFVEFKIYFP